MSRRCARSWLAVAIPVSDKVLAGAAGPAQYDGGGAIGRQRRQPGPVGAQGVGEHEGVEPVVLVPGRFVAAAQVLDLVPGDHDHRDTDLEQRGDDRAVWALGGYAGAVVKECVCVMARNVATRSAVRYRWPPGPP